MSLQVLTYIVVCLSFVLYIGIAFWSRAHNTGDFYIAGKGVSPLANGMATAADWMSAASFISMAGIIAFSGYDGSVYLMGWTGGYVLLALLLAPYLRKFGKFTVPEFIGERYYSKAARIGWRGIRGPGPRAHVGLEKAVSKEAAFFCPRFATSVDLSLLHLATRFLSAKIYEQTKADGLLAGQSSSPWRLSNNLVCLLVRFRRVARR